MQKLLIISLLSVLSTAAMAISPFQITSATATKMTKGNGNTSGITYQLTLSIPSSVKLPYGVGLVSIAPTSDSTVPNATMTNTTCEFDRKKSYHSGESCTVTYAASVPALKDATQTENFHQSFQVIDTLGKSVNSPDFNLTVQPAGKLAFTVNGVPVSQLDLGDGSTGTLELRNTGQADINNVNVAIPADLKNLNLFDDKCSGKVLTNTKPCDITIDMNNPPHGSYSIVASGDNMSDVTLPVSLQNQSAFSVLDGTASTNAVTVKAGSSKTITIKNTALNSANQFSLSMPQSLSAYASGTCVTTQKLDAAATCNLVLSVPSNDPDITGNITVNASNAVAPANLKVTVQALPRLAFQSNGQNIENLAISTSSTGTLKLKNTGNQEVKNVAVDIPNALTNSITQNDCTGTDLNASATCDVTYDTSGKNVPHATYTITPSSNSSTQGAVGIPLDLEVSAAGHFNFEQNNKEVSQLSFTPGQTGSFTIKNTGGSAITEFSVAANQSAIAFSAPSSGTACPIASATGSLAVNGACSLNYTVGSTLGKTQILLTGNHVDNNNFRLPVFVYKSFVTTNGPEGADIQALLLDGSTLYAGAQEAGLFTSTDNGVNWQKVPVDDFPNTSVYKLTKMNNVLYAGTWSSGVYYKTTSASTWAQLPLPNDVDKAWVRSMYVDMSNKTLYVGLENGDIYTRGTNLSASWTKLNAPSLTSGAYSILVDNGNIFAGTSSNGLFELAANNWQATSLTSGSVRSIFKLGSNLYAGLGSQVYTSTNNGVSWATVGGIVGGTIYTINFWNGKIIVGTRNGVFQHAAGTWNSIDSNQYLFTLDLLPQGNDLYAAVVGSGNEGVFKVTTTNLSWQPLIKGMVGTRINDLASSGTNKMNANLFVGVHQWDEGANQWLALDNANRPANIYSLASNTDTIYVGTKSRVEKYNPQSASWAYVGENPILGQNHDITALKVLNGTIYAGLENGDVYSIPSNSGSTAHWTQAGSNSCGSDVVAFAVIGTNIYAAAKNNGVFMLSGSTWANISHNLPSNNFYLNGLVTVNNTLYVSDYYNGVYSLSGTTWTKLPGSSTYTMGIAAVDNQLYARTLYASLQRYDTSDHVWYGLTSGLPSGVSSLSFAGTTDSIYIGTYGRGVYKSNFN